MDATYQIDSLRAEVRRLTRERDELREACKAAESVLSDRINDARWYTGEWSVLVDQLRTALANSQLPA